MLGRPIVNLLGFVGPLFKLLVALQMCPIFGMGVVKEFMTKVLFYSPTGKFNALSPDVPH